MLRVSHPKSWGAQCSGHVHNNWTSEEEIPKKNSLFRGCRSCCCISAVVGCTQTSFCLLWVCLHTFPAPCTQCWHNEIMVSNLGASISQDETPKQRNPCQEKSSTILLDSRALSIFISIDIVMIGSNHLFPPPLFQQVGYSSAQPCHKRRPHPQRPRTSQAVVFRANLHRSFFHSDK